MSETSTNQSKHKTLEIAQGLSDSMNEISIHRLFFGLSVGGYVVIAYSGNLTRCQDWIRYVAFIVIVSALASFIRAMVPVLRNYESTKRESDSDPGRQSKPLTVKISSNNKSGSTDKK